MRKIFFPYFTGSHAVSCGTIEENCCYFYCQDCKCFWNSNHRINRCDQCFSSELNTYELNCVESVCLCCVGVFFFFFSSRAYI